ncbi:MAG: KH domain-containing protein [Clostridia bacterium]|nr:KH domain-containing protein [Clostridia bacterium]MBQ3154065.1 KH domain-containing protein [Clostridia bacterium]
MKQMLIDLVQAIVDYPEEVSVNEKISGDTVVLELTVAKRDMGRVIGREGKIAKSIRTVMRAQAAREHKRVIVDIL